ncbi:MAG: hypothetical protein LIO79_06305 [Rikenellaceae bacterium]|nr:hypothetical protein [Rikenellaceae bacterium]
MGNALFLWERGEDGPPSGRWERGKKGGRDGDGSEGNWGGENVEEMVVVIDRAGIVHSHSSSLPA